MRLLTVLLIQMIVSEHACRLDKRMRLPLLPDLHMGTTMPLDQQVEQLRISREGNYRVRLNCSDNDFQKRFHLII